eukprot:TRINITY_DN3465_c0_g1_i1.p2 TRINITY_DN3465_c0_g1~~TRINITY_DN3465_c0_g1_i1.p2  ORF type:complete len:60 (+),score=12.84 TRINITY_DN3465_c0_g1_i1:123-302(+)
MGTIDSFNKGSSISITLVPGIIDFRHLVISSYVMYSALIPLLCVHGYGRSSETAKAHRG